MDFPFHQKVVDTKTSYPHTPLHFSFPADGKDKKLKMS